MFRLTASTFRAAAIAIPALLATSIAVPAVAQSSVSISYNEFHNRLAPYGTWSNHPRWGEVWHPTRVNRDFRPYYDGHWENTNEYGWLWVSDESWGDIPYHYGRWVSDPREGWLWVPGYVWGPSWVVWRSGGGNIGWFPMPPDDDYYGQGSYRDNYDNQYGYRDWYGPSFGAEQFLSLWIFVGEDHFRDRNFRNYAVPQRDYGRFISQTRDTTNYITINNYVVNRSIDENRLQQVTKQRSQPVPARNVLGRNALVRQANEGRQVEQRERQQHPIPSNVKPDEQRGRGNVNQNAQPPIPDRGAPDTQGRGGNRNQGGNDAGQATPQNRDAPVASTPRQSPNQAQQDAQGRGGNRNQGPNDAGQATRQNRDAPVASAPPVPNQGQQDAQGRGGNRTQDANCAAQEKPQAGRNAEVAPPAAVANTPPPKENAASQSVPERRNGGGQTGRQNDRAAQPSQPAQGRETPAQNSKADAQDNRAPARARENVRAPNAQDNARGNQARGSNQGEAKNTGQDAAAEQKTAADKKSDDDKKNAGAGRGRN